MVQPKTIDFGGLRNAIRSVLENLAGGDGVGFGYMRILLYVYLLVRTCLYVRHAEVCFVLFVGRERRREGASRLRDHTADTRGN